MGSFEDRELFSDGERGVVGEHDSARAKPDAFGLRREVSNQDRRRCCRDSEHVVVLRDPIACEARPIGNLRQ